MHQEKSTKIISVLNKITPNIKEDNDGFIEVLSGDLSNSLYFLYKGLVTKDNTSLEKAIELIDTHIDLANENVYNCKFAYGYPGLGWLLTFLHNINILPDLDDSFVDELDKIIYGSFTHNIKTRSYDLFFGSVGKGMYFLERNEPKTIEYIKAIISYLEKSATKFGEHELAWLDHYTSYHDPTPRKEIPYYNLGMAHGIPSIICFLGNCWKRGIETSKCENLIKKSSAWLVKQRSFELQPLLFPSKVLLQNEYYPIEANRKLAWCYGDLSIALSLYVAGQILNDSKLIDASKEISLNASRLTQSELESFVKFSRSSDDICFCHGSAGLAHIFNKLNKCHLENDLKNASDYWLEKTLNFFENSESKKIHQRGLLEGTPGIGMVLLDFINEEKGESKVNLPWNKIFFTNVDVYSDL